jgi:hypothetical protein
MSLLFKRQQTRHTELAELVTCDCSRYCKRRGIMAKQIVISVWHCKRGKQQRSCLEYERPNRCSGGQTNNTWNRKGQRS